MSLLSEATPVAAVSRRAHSLLEGPRIAQDGVLVYSDVLGGGLFGCDGDGVISEIVPRRRGIGGVLAHADGGWVISGRTVIHVGGDSERELLADPDAAGYNDLGVLPGGELLAGELRFRPFAGEEPRPGRLVALGRSGELRVLSDEVLWPNGIGVAPGGGTVYISDYARKLVLAIPTDSGPASTFATVPSGSPDGLAVDLEGGVWVALGDAGAVARFRADGELEETVDLPAGFVSSLSFGGPDMCDVLISTADNRVEPQLGGTLLRARSEVAGLPLAPVQV